MEADHEEEMEDGVDDEGESEALHHKQEASGGRNLLDHGEVAGTQEMDCHEQRGDGVGGNQGGDQVDVDVSAAHQVLGADH